MPLQPYSCGWASPACTGPAGRSTTATRVNEIGRRRPRPGRHAGIKRDVPVGFDAIRLRFELDAADASAEEVGSLIEKTERYCTVLQTLTDPPKVEKELRLGT